MHWRRCPLPDLPKETAATLPLIRGTVPGNWSKAIMQTLTDQQKQFFETFGYLILPGLLADDVGWITEEFEAAFRDRGVVHDGTKRSCIVPFIDQRELLCTLLDHPRVEGLIAS